MWPLAQQEALKMDLGFATWRVPSYGRPPVRSRAELSRTVAYLPGCLGCPRRADRSPEPGRSHLDRSHSSPEKVL